jgi:hypothetical protein
MSFAHHTLVDHLVHPSSVPALEIRCNLSFDLDQLPGIH